MTEREKILFDALSEIVDPISFMRKRLKDDEKLDGIYAELLSREACYLKDIANKALREFKGIRKYYNGKEIVEAIQWNTGNNILIAQEWLGSNLISEEREGIGVMGYWVKTPIDDTMISFGDYIIKEACGDFYVCKPNNFEKLFKEIP